MRRNRANRWTAALMVLALSASVAGLLLDGLYAGATYTAEMLRGYDLITAAVVVPALAVATWMARQGSVQAQLTSASLITYLVYTYAYYLFGTGFNPRFLLHAAVLATGVVTLALHLTTIDVAAFADRVRTGRRVRGAAAVLGVLATALGGMWVYFAVDNAVTGDIPPGSRLVETDTIVHHGMALDLALLVPLYAAAAYLLWRRSVWGYVLGTISLVAGVLHQISYMVAMLFQVAADIPGAVSYDPGEPVIVLLYLLGAALLLGRPPGWLSDREPGEPMTRIEGRRLAATHDRRQPRGKSPRRGAPGADPMCRRDEVMQQCRRPRRHRTETGPLRILLVPDWSEKAHQGPRFCVAGPVAHASPRDGVATGRRAVFRTRRAPVEPTSWQHATRTCAPRCQPVRDPPDR